MELRLGRIRKHKAVKGQLSNRTYQLIESDRAGLAAQAHAMLGVIVLTSFGFLFEQPGFDELDHIPTSIGATTALELPNS